MRKQKARQVFLELNRRMKRNPVHLRGILTSEGLRFIGHVHSISEIKSDGEGRWFAKCFTGSEQKVEGTVIFLLEDLAKKILR